MLVVIKIMLNLDLDMIVVTSPTYSKRMHYVNLKNKLEC